MVAIASLATLHSLAILPLAWRVTRISAPHHFAGAAYTATLPSSAHAGLGEPAVRVREDAILTIFSMSSGEGTVARFGGGRYHVAGNTLFFSARDNSDPRLNGRTYDVEEPYPAGGWVLAILWAAAALSSVPAAVRHRAAFGRFVQAAPFGAVALLFLVLFASNRLWLFVNYPIPAIHPDSASYYVVAESIGSGAWPIFGIRPPVYPVLMRLVFAISDRITSLIAVQTGSAAIAGLIMVYGIWRWSRGLAWLGAIAMALYSFANAAMEHDTAMLSESLYTSLLIVSFGAFLAVWNSTRPWLWLSIVSTVMALAILTRPAGLFLVVTYVMIAGWLLWNRAGRASLGSFLVPLPVLMLLISIYNLSTVGVFAITVWGEANLAVASFTYWQTDPAYPADVNHRIVEIQHFVSRRFAETRTDQNVVDVSWNPVALSHAFVLGFHESALNTARQIGNGRYETSGRAWIRRIALDSIRKRPLVYTKFVYTMLFNYFHPAADVDFRDYLRNRVQNLYIDRHFSRTTGNPMLARIGKEFADDVPPPGIIVSKDDAVGLTNLSDLVLVRPTALWRLYELTHELRAHVMTLWVWPVAFFAALANCVVVFLRSRARSTAAFVVVVIGLSAVGASLIVSLVEFSQPRYSYPMEWSYLIVAILLPLALSRSSRPQSL
jgi:hypothetical protein